MSTDGIPKMPPERDASSLSLGGFGDTETLEPAAYIQKRARALDVESVIG